MTLLVAFCVHPEPVVREKAWFWFSRSFTPIMISPRWLRKTFLPSQTLQSR